MIRLPALLIACIFLLPLPAMAWSNLGHRLVGELAQRHLTAAANAQVAGLLQGEAEPSLAGIASWADTLRKDDPQAYPGSDRWHYVNFPARTCTYEPPRDCPDGNCVVGQIERQRLILADRTQPVAVRRDALKFLVHFVGDAHQPLHNSNYKDKGGNDYQISLRTPLVPTGELASKYVDGVMGTNLHSIWDYYVLASAGLTADGYSERLGTRPWPPENIGKSPRPADWSMEACKLIDAHRLYPKGHRLDHRYLDAQRPLAERQVEIAAKRLADLLNATLVN
ncbi:S1/P1 nuclease [Pseudoxanthomonas gei]|uniref:S1/P1 nuclease n=1 Tax=Pseudoxanthomonas gei TaxID=1383030 RepID=UPI001FEA7960|nr:S1/P1 nuclease [Pseudoxanthomonas gei]